MTREQDKPQRFYILVTLNPLTPVTEATYEFYPEAHDAAEDYLIHGNITKPIYIMLAWQKATQKGVLFESIG